MKDIILIGGGGHCKACIDVIEKEQKYSIVGIIDKKEKVGTKVLGYPIIAEDSEIPSLAKKYDNFIITIGQIGNSEIRRNIFYSLKTLKINIPTIISPSAIVSKHAKIDEGTIIFHGAIVNANASIGYNSIINTRAVVEHDAIIGNHCHISTGSIVNGGVRIGDNVFYGSGTISKEYVEVLSNTIIGANSFVNRSIDIAGVYVGIPIKRIN